MSRFASALLALSLLAGCFDREGRGGPPLPFGDGGSAADAGDDDPPPGGPSRRDGGAVRDGGARDGGPAVLPPEIVVVEVDRLAPDRGPSSGGTEIVLSGKGFLRDTVVTIGGVALVDPRIEGERRITGRTPPGAPGVAPVLVENRAGRVEVAGGFTYFDPVTISGVVPSRGGAAGGTAIAVSGTGFVPGSTLLVGARPAFDVRVESLTRLTAVTPPGTPGAAPISVVNRNGGATLERGFTYVDDLVLSAVDPPVGPLAGGNTVRVLGAGFDAAARVFFGGAAATLVAARSAGELVVRVPGGAAPGAVDVAVLGEAGAARLAGGYAYADGGGTLALHAVVPRHGPASGGTDLWLAGAGFDTGVIAVRVGGSDATALAVDAPGVMRAVTPPGTAGPADVTVFASGGRSVTLPAAFLYEGPLAVTEVRPAEGPVAGGTPVEIRGEGFAAGAAVFFGPVAAPSVDVVDAATLRTRTPPGAAGPVDVTVRVGERSSILPNGFAYFDTPRIYRVSPGHGAIAGGTYVVITGTGFTESSQPYFDGLPAVEVSLLDAATITARTPPGVPGPADVVVLAERGAAVLPRGYTYFDPTATFGGTSGGPVRGAVNVTVVDGNDGSRLPGAYVTLATTGTTLYQGIADRNGQVVFSGPDLGGRQVVTAAKEGYSAGTVVSFDAENVTIFLSPIGGAFGFGPGPDLGTIRGTLISAFKGVPPPPNGYRKAVIVTTTTPDRFTPNPNAAGVVQIYVDDGREDRPYEINTRAGDLAVYALAGHLSLDATDFIPHVMGIHRHLTMPVGGFLDGIDLRVDAALNATLDARLLNAPPLDAVNGPNAYRVRVFLELGSDGTATFFRIPESRDQPRVVHDHLPAIAGSIAGSTFTVVGGAYNVFEGEEFSPLTQTTVTRLVDLNRTLEIGPLMGLATAVRPADADFLDGNRFVWALPTPPDPAFSLVYVLQPAGLGFVTIWEMIVPGPAREVQLPDLTALAGLTGIPGGEVLYWAVIPALGPAFAIDAFDYRAFDTRGWTSYSIAPFVFLTR